MNPTTDELVLPEVSRRRYNQVTTREWCNGSTSDSDSLSLGSNPSSRIVVSANLKGACGRGLQAPSAFCHQNATFVAAALIDLAHGLSPRRVCSRPLPGRPTIAHSVGLAAVPKLTQQRLEAHLWGAANILRGRVAGQEYKAYIFILLFFKRLSDQWEDEPAELVTKHGRRNGRQFTAAQKAKLLMECEPQFKVPDGCRWDDVTAAPTGLGAKLTDAARKIAAANPDLASVFAVDWNQPAPDGKGQLIPEDVVRALLNHFSAYRLSSAHVPADVLGRAYEYLLKKFADDAGQAAGEFFTPTEVVDCLVRILQPKAGETVYDPTCGSGGMLVHTADFLAERGQTPQAVRYFGQELNRRTFAIARINTILQGWRRPWPAAGPPSPTRPS